MSATQNHQDTWQFRNVHEAGLVFVSWLPPASSSASTANPPEIRPQPSTSGHEPDIVHGFISTPTTDANTSFRKEDRSSCEYDVALQSNFPSTALQGKGDPQSQVVRDVDPASSRPHGQGPRPGRIFGGRSGNVGFTWYRVGLDRGWDASDVVGTITQRPQGSFHSNGGDFV
ncbi:uncharacterized protein NECHADRAFT_88053 [Fusarium vanettenii 77-13-4]|uniref:Uncharacterized protein n=1 Tax=Fusarium vanettenii (strain ATCC MYA-4622 / CBS 123669 / FGSC 9596 / NRRL 45880 / 77-13-4) TaxID=660122 RepID=C7ZL41_FUSV7|nr:uncharacterized protein NECHADRAFT_88053 [Fusarium vanettenii 77-13-4]EEU35224.1 predicted protein [Fusarium vanettenii 77-13-4]